MNHLYRMQFLLTKEVTIDFTWDYKSIMFSDYTLYYHSEMEFTNSQSTDLKLIMLGSIYCWETPSLTNQELLDNLSKCSSIKIFLEQLSEYCGQYIIFYHDKERFILLNDACAQKEIYYDTTFNFFGSQPKIMTEILKPISHSLKEAAEFYNSPEFQKNEKVCVGDTTHFENIKHLLPNHYIDITNKKVVRFFPCEPLTVLSLNEVADKGCQMLQGYIKAIGMRKKMAMAVTSGYDSRTLFLASINEDCKYFIFQKKSMTKKHPDIYIPERLTKFYKKDFEIIPEEDELEDAKASLDFSRNMCKVSKTYENHIYLNGNLAEIARSFYDFTNNKIKADDLATIFGYFKNTFVINVFEKWLENKNLFDTTGFDSWDMFYWEIRCGVWAAKEKTLWNAVGRDIISPFCSRNLLKLLLSTQARYRMSSSNKLFKTMMLKFSTNALDLPFNPTLKSNIIRILKIMRIYPIYNAIRLRYGLLL